MPVPSAGDGTGSRPTDELTQLAALRDRGMITEAGFQRGTLRIPA